MKILPIIIAVGCIIGASFLAFNSDSQSLQKEIQPAQYDKEISKRYAAYSKIAYCPEASVQNWTCKDCKIYNQVQDLHVISNPKRSIFGYAFYDTGLNRIILVWRGTIDMKNKVNDFTFEKIPYTCRQCQVHLGFYEAFRSVAKDTYDVVQKLFAKYPEAKMTVTGHSLGAALSTISAIETNKKSPNLATQIHNFGCPRIGNEKLAQHIRDQFETLFRVVHNHDIYTHLPEQSQNFAHYPFEVLYDEKMENYQICDDSGQDPTCSNSYAPNYNPGDHFFYFFPMNGTDC